MLQKVECPYIKKSKETLREEVGGAVLRANQVSCMHLGGYETC